MIYHGFEVLISGSADSSSSEDESFFGGTATSTVWIGNDDGEWVVITSLTDSCVSNLTVSYHWLR